MQIPSNCPNLEVLRIDCSDSLRIDLSRTEMSTFATSLPQLRILQLYQVLYFDAADLRLLAACCSDLEECTVDGMELLSLKTEEPPLFPQLRKPHLYEVFDYDSTEDDETNLSRYIEIIEYHMPHLEDFYFATPDSLEKDINRGLKQWTKSNKRVKVNGVSSTGF